MGLPDKRYRQFYCDINSGGYTGDPIFLWKDDAEKKLRNLKKKLENMLLEDLTNER